MTSHMTDFPKDGQHGLETNVPINRELVMCIFHMGPRGSLTVPHFVNVTFLKQVV